MIVNRPIRRFDQFDYEGIGLKDRWYVYQAAEMLTCFEMETKNYYTLDDPQTAYSKINDKYELFIKDAIFKKVGGLPHFTPNESNYAGQGGIEIPIVFSSKITAIAQDDLIEYITKNNKPRIDVAKLKRFLSGEEAPDSMIHRMSRPVEQDAAVVQPADGTGTDASHTIRTKDTNDHGYSFESKGNSWDIQYNDVVLKGVKGWAGMNYIKILLQNPGVPIEVRKLQAQVEAGHVEPDIPANDSFDGIDKRGMQECRERLAQIEEQLTTAKAGSVLNKTKMQRLENEKSEIEKYLNEANHKLKDPDIEKARKHVLKVVTDAIAKIKRLEEHCNYNDKPISSHLKRYIKTGSYCSYSADGDNLPPWKF